MSFRIKYSISSFLIVLGIVVSSALWAQKPNLKFKTIDQSHGLANGTVQAIFEDSFGFIWLGTQGGVQKYDGKKFVTFTYSDNDTNGLAANYINAFCEDSDKDVWIATGSGLNRYNRERDLVERYWWNDSRIAANGEPFLSTLISDPTDKNILWITALGVGLIKIDVLTDSTTIYPVNITNDRSFVWMQPHPLAANKLLMGSTTLISFDKEKGTFEEILQLEQNTEVHENIINAMALDPKHDGIIWLATGDPWGRGEKGGLIKYDLNDHSSQIFSMETRPGEILTNSMLSIHFHNESKLWIGSRINGALLYQIDMDRFYYYNNNEYDKGSFVTDNAVRSILLDRSGCCWFGTWGDGMSILSPSTQKFSHYKHLPGDDSGLPDNFVNTFAEDKDGNIWIGTESGGLSKFMPKERIFENYFQEFTAKSNIIHIMYLFYDSRHNLWIGTYNDALYRFNPETGEKLHFAKGNSSQHVSQKRITGISEFEPGEIMVSTYGGGLNIYSYETNTFRRFLHDPDDSTSIPDNQIWLPVEGPDGYYYFCGNSTHGLIRFDPEEEIFSPLFVADLTTFNMPAKTPEGKIYIDDVSRGLLELVIDEEIKVKSVIDKEGNAITNIESMVFDEEGNLWIATGNGLIRFNPATKDLRRYDADDGLQGHSFNQVAGIKTANGKMYFGGKNGLSFFNPNGISLSNYKPLVVFTSFKLFQEDVAIGEGSALPQNLLLMDEIILDHQQNDFSFSFAALDYSNPEKNSYMYMLENHDNDWIMAGSNNEAAYTNMDPGKYLFKVMATNGDGVWNDEVQSMRIIINPPWWQTTWAYLGYALLFIGVVIAIDRIQRRRLLEKEKAQAREKELAQAKEIEKAYTRLKNTQEQLLHSEKMASLGELTAGIAHEIQNPLNFVNNFSEVNTELITELKEEINSGNLAEVKGLAEDIERNERKITHHGRRADGIVKGMLQHSRSGAGQKELSDINIIADEYLRLSYHGLRAKDKSFNAEFITEFDQSLSKINIVPQDIGRVLLNLFNNAFHAVSEKANQGLETYKPMISVASKAEGDKIIVSVKDNGNGIPKEIMDKIFQPFFTTKESGEGTGLGLSISYDIITKGHNGTLDVNSRSGDGTEFILTIPLDK